MSLKRMPLLAMLFGCVLTGCVATSAIPYVTSAKNVLGLQQAVKQSGLTVGLGEFTESTEIGTLVCRLINPIDVSRGMTRPEYIRDALQTELLLAGAYSAESEIRISGKLDDLSFNSWFPGRWYITFTASSNKSPGYTVRSESVIGIGAGDLPCEKVTDSFGVAIQDLIWRIIVHPQFPSLLGKQQ